MVFFNAFMMLAFSSISLAAPAADKRWGGGGSRHGWWQPTRSSSYIDYAGRFSFDDCECDLSKAQLPQAPTPLPAPAAGLSVYQVSVGRGTQNYTCATSDASTTPVPIGAVASLYNVSCLAANFPDLLSYLPRVALESDMPVSDDPKSPTNTELAGHHYFIGPTTPFFNFDTDQHQWGASPFSKISNVSAPSDAMVGKNDKGFGAVAWLQLDTMDTSGKLQQVYRVNTAGGNPPATCDGMPKAFEIQYAAEYWTYA